MISSHFLHSDCDVEIYNPLSGICYSGKKYTKRENVQCYEYYNPKTLRCCHFYLVKPAKTPIGVREKKICGGDRTIFHKTLKCPKFCCGVAPCRKRTKECGHATPEKF